jgi:hypothetical protein
MRESCQRGWDKYGGSLKKDEKITIFLAACPACPPNSQPLFSPRKVTWIPSALLHGALFLADHFCQLGRREFLCGAAGMN